MSFSSGGGMSGRQSELTDCNPTTMTGTTACGVGGSWVWGCDGDVDVGEGEVTASDDDNEGSADVEGNVGIDAKPSEVAVDDATGEVGGTNGVGVVTAPPGTKPCRKLSRRGGMTGGKRYNLHQLILPDASIRPEPRVGVRVGLFNTGFEACPAE